ncbi:MAG: sensor histidine kinase [Clostridia bacterium]|nr:sensor histidine kinase [Clostridia bacterium]
MAKQEIEYYKKQFKIISETQDTIKMMHHDMKNHVIVLKALANKTNSQEVNLYLSEYLDLLDIDNSIAKSGNINVDSILNYKLSEAEKKEITVQLVYKIPEKLNVLEFDLEVVIGNLFDNAIEAVEKMSINNKWIKIEIEYDRGIIFIVFSNPYIYVNENLESTKMDSRMHGIGLKSVARIVNKYNGEIEINKEENVFQINILMYEKG